MKEKKKVLALLALLAVAAALAWVFGVYHVVDFRLYPRDAAVLDLRGQEVSVKHHRKLAEKFPNSTIRWDVPFQGTRLPDDTVEVTVTELTAQDAAVLAECLPKLRTVHAVTCRDYDALLLLKQQRPAVQVNYRVPIQGTSYAGTAIQLTLAGITEEELSLLPYLPRLISVTVEGGETQLLEKLRDYCRSREIGFRLKLGGAVVEEDASVLTVTGITGEELNLLPLLPRLKQLHLKEPEAPAENLLVLADRLPGTAVSWEKSVLGKTFRQDAEVIDLTDVIARAEGAGPEEKTAYQHSLEYPVQGTKEEEPSSVKLSKYHPLPDKTGQTGDLIGEVEAALAYFPQAKKLLMCGAVLDNEAMSRFREARRDTCSVVWTVKCGMVATRTDAEFFMPVKYHVYYLLDEDAYNLRYCEDMVCIDIGHMAVSDIRFVEFMPDLEYLILAHTQVQYIEPIRSCKKLKFLEVDWTPLRDFSPLTDCTGLEDLNIGNTWADTEPIKKMTWLNNLWMVFRGGAYELSQALPDTKVVASGEATVDSGWRDLPNYYAMRDRLYMYYMSW